MRHERLKGFRLNRRVPRMAQMCTAIPVLVSFVVGTGALSVAQKGTVPPQAIHPYSTTEFVSSIQRLPQQFRGHNAETIWKILNQKSKSFTKSEYETEAAFETRISAFATEPLLGNLRPSSTFAFVVPIVESSYRSEERRVGKECRSR